MSPASFRRRRSSSSASMRGSIAHRGDHPLFLFAARPERDGSRKLGMQHDYTTIPRKEATRQADRCRSLQPKPAKPPLPSSANCAGGSGRQLRPSARTQPAARRPPVRDAHQRQAGPRPASDRRPRSRAAADDRPPVVPPHKTPNPPELSICQSPRPRPPKQGATERQPDQAATGSAVRDARPRRDGVGRRGRGSAPGAVRVHRTCG